MMPTRNNYTGFPKMGEPVDRLTAFRAALRPMIAKMADRTDEADATHRKAGK